MVYEKPSIWSSLSFTRVSSERVQYVSNSSLEFAVTWPTPESSHLSPIDGAALLCPFGSTLEPFLCPSLLCHFYKELIQPQHLPHPFTFAALCNSGGRGNGSPIVWFICHWDTVYQWGMLTNRVRTDFLSSGRWTAQCLAHRGTEHTLEIKSWGSWLDCVDCWRTWALVGFPGWSTSLPP